ncbi:uncharacterized protein B0H18DRAFT_30850 [Fomitopsis serialis]|uniref:uncharacterized protein n=1 Tax=Fomitopsis serialis TaxID=139415 RepID=UPI0020088966|nr:uncharacterized protein B0H18DRAFT_30850 [Neoantrodia serialis]KAH9932583.1 hypothetical protein B0H18DRAFT_30850 [Neoantrodia serialis]
MGEASIASQMRVAPGNESRESRARHCEVSPRKMRVRTELKILGGSEGRNRLRKHRTGLAESQLPQRRCCLEELDQCVQRGLFAP